MIKSFDTVVTIVTTTSSITLRFTGIGLIMIPISTVIACGVSIGNKVIKKIIITKYHIYKKQYEKDQQTIKSLITYTVNFHKIL